MYKVVQPVFVSLNHNNCTQISFEKLLNGPMVYGGAHWPSRYTSGCTSCPLMAAVSCVSKIVTWLTNMKQNVTL